MILENVSERFHYMSGYFENVLKNPENYKKSDLVHYLKIMNQFFDLPYKPFDTENIGRF